MGAAGLGARAAFWLATAAVEYNTRVTGSDLTPQTFFESVQHTFEQAVRISGLVERDYSLVDGRLRLRFAGPALMPGLTPAIDHLSTLPEPLAAPDLSVAIWESASTGVTLPVRLPPLNQIGLRGELPCYSDERYLAAVQRDVGALSVLDQATGQAVYWIASAADLRAYERAAPLKIILHWWLRRRGWPMLHAGVIGTDEGALLLVGKSGAGKSTTTLACMQAGWKFISDDRCLVKVDDQPEAFCIYNTAKLHLQQMQKFADLLPSVSNPGESGEKALVYIYQHAPAQLARRLPLRAVVLGHISGRRQTTLQAVSLARVLRDLATSSMVYQPGMAGDELCWMTALLKKLPCYQVNLGTELEDIPAALAQVIHDESAG